MLFKLLSVLLTTVQGLPVSELKMPSVLLQPVMCKQNHYLTSNCHRFGDTGIEYKRASFSQEALVQPLYTAVQMVTPRLQVISSADAEFPCIVKHSKTFFLTTL